jgi:hypothetical protein
MVGKGCGIRIKEGCKLANQWGLFAETVKGYSVAFIQL